MNKQDKNYNTFHQHCIQYKMYIEFMNKCCNSRNIPISKYYSRLHSMLDNLSHSHSDKCILLNNCKLHLLESLIGMSNIGWKMDQSTLDMINHSLMSRLQGSLSKPIRIHFPEYKILNRMFLGIKLKDWSFSD